MPGVVGLRMSATGVEVRDLVPYSWPLLCATTLDASVRQWRGATQVWDRSEKTGKVAG